MSEAFDADEIRQSQIPAAQLLGNIGFEILPRARVEIMRGKLSNVLLEEVLAERILALSSFHWKGETRAFNQGDAEEAIRKLKPDPARLRGLVGANQDVYDALMLGATIEKLVDGDRKSFDVRYIDWERPENNRYHAALEFSVERTGSHDTKRCDIVLFVNGIPFVTIENKNPLLDLKQAVSQTIGYQNADNIPHLYHFVQLVIAANRGDARYATVGTPAKFWSAWHDEQDTDDTVAAAANAPLSASKKDALFSGEFATFRAEFDKTEGVPRLVTAQDRALFALCRPERLLALARTFTVFDGGVRKIARYQQFFAVHEAMRRIRERDSEGRRRGGVIWHTQGSGKSLTMVMLGKALAFTKDEVKRPRIVIVTDREDLDKQIKDTFKACEMNPVRATTGRDLLKRLEEGETLITAIINKFDRAARVAEGEIADPDVFVMVDESHRTQYGAFAARMRKLLPLACYIGFTGTPLLKDEKSTLSRFGGLIHKYAIDRAVRDGAVVPLLYEGRFVDQKVSGPGIDAWFDKMSEGLNGDQRADLRSKFSRMQLLSQTEQVIYAKALDISEHYRQIWQDTGFKAQLVAPSKASAIRFKEILDDIGHVTSAVIISAPDDREGNDEVDKESKDKVRVFWDAAMKDYGSEVEYNRQVIEAFKGSGDPEILIVVSKLLTGFDAPRNTVLYVCRDLREHNLLQAIARVNRLFEEDGTEKEFGYIVDYQGLLGELDQALNTYAQLEGYDEEDLVDVVHDVRDEIKRLAGAHGDVWDIFRDLPNKKDMEAFEQHLASEELRDEFYARLREFGRLLHLAMGSEKTFEIYSEADLEKFGRDWKRFDALRRAVRIRYQEAVAFKEYEPKVRALLDKHIIAEPARVLIETVDITDPEALAKVMAEAGVTPASKADRIASATTKTITERMDKDPALYESFYNMLEQVIAEYRARRLSELEYLAKVMEVAKDVAKGSRRESVPASISSDDDAKAFYGIVRERFASLPGDDGEGFSAEVAKAVADAVRKRMIVNFWTNDQAKNALLNELDDYFFSAAVRERAKLAPEQLDTLMQDLLRVARARFPA